MPGSDSRHGMYFLYVVISVEKNWMPENRENSERINKRSSATSLLSSLSVIVSEPEALLAWLETNGASHIAALHVHLDAYQKAPPAARWSRLFEKRGREATNLQHLSVYWDHEGCLHRGLGKHVFFLSRRWFG